MEIKYCECGCGTIVDRRFVSGHNIRLVQPVNRHTFLPGEANIAKRPDIRRKISEAKIGHLVSKETREKFSKIFKGRKHTEEEKRKIGLSLKGRTLSEGTKHKLSEAHKGKYPSEETRRKMGDAGKGRIPWNKGKTGLLSEEARARMSMAQKGNLHHKGRFHLEETKSKISESKKGQSPPNKGKKGLFHHSEEFRKRHAITMKEHWNNPEFRQRIVTNTLKASHIRPNFAEKRLDGILQRILPNEYRYVGDGSFILDGKNPDFVNCNGKKKIIDLFGERWHNPEEELPRKDAFAKYGFEALVVWGKELSDVSTLTRKLLEFQNTSSKVI